MIDLKMIAQAIRRELADEISKMPCKPRLDVFWVGNNPASKTYVMKKYNAAQEVGIDCVIHHLAENITQEELEEIILRADMDDGHGMLVQLPLPKHLDTLKICDKIPIHKDVDVLNPYNIGLLVQNRPNFLPCTPQGIQMMFSRGGIQTKGKHLVIINRSLIVGKPLSSMLIQDNDYANATVTVCHDNTPPDQLKSILQIADIIIVAVGIRGFLTKDMVKPHQIVIDVGINREGNKIYGDVDPAVKEIVKSLSPVPGGVGLFTICALLKNTIKACKM